MNSGVHAGVRFRGSALKCFAGQGLHNPSPALQAIALRQLCTHLSSSICIVYNMIFQCQMTSAHAGSIRWHCYQLDDI